MNNMFRGFGSFSKVEEHADGTITVYGVASTGTRDSAGEIVDPDAMRAALPSFQRFPTLREMHQSIAAGRVTEAYVDDDGATQIAALVVDPVAISKIKNQVYAAFSIGGKVTKRDPDDRTIIRGLTLVEISLVDVPACPDAVLTMWKTDMIDFKPASADVVAKAKEMAAAAGTKRFKDYVFEAAETLVAEYMLKAADAEEEIEVEPEAPAPAAEPLVEEPAAPAEEPAPVADAPVAEAVADPAKEAAATADPEDTDTGGENPDGDAIEAEKAAVADPAAALADALSKAGEVVAEAAPVAPVAAVSPWADFAKASAALKAIEIKSDLSKGLYQVSRFADLLCSLAGLQGSVQCEADMEGDGSPVPAKLAEAISALGALLVEMAQEEIAEVIDDMKTDAEAEIVYMGDGDVMMLAEEIVDLVKADADLMEKAGARNSKSDSSRIQASHDHMAKLGATCDSENCPETEKVAKAEIVAERDRLAKALEDAAPAVVELTKGFSDTVDGLKGMVADLEKRFAELDQTPLPPKTAGSNAAVSKAADSSGHATTPEAPVMSAEAYEKAMASLTPEERALVLVKASLQQPVSIRLR